MGYLPVVLVGSTVAVLIVDVGVLEAIIKLVGVFGFKKQKNKFN